MYWTYLLWQHFSKVYNSEKLKKSPILTVHILMRKIHSKLMKSKMYIMLRGDESREEKINKEAYR